MREHLAVPPALAAAVCALILLPQLFADVVDGRKSFATLCSACHGADGRGGERAPDIVSRGGARTESSLRELIRAGLPERGMPGLDLAPTEMASLVAFVRTLSTNTKIAGTAAPARSLDFTQVANPRPGEWPTYHGQLNGNRHSPLDQINLNNVARLAPKWIFPIASTQRLEVTPVVVDGVMYVTAANEAYALDARNGRQYWSFRRPRTPGLAGDAASGINRGVAVLEDRLFLVTDNAHLIALDRRDGHLLWEVEMADSSVNYGATSAPLIARDLVISGISGGDEGVRGFFAAYKPSTGERVWRFWTVPAPGEPLAKTWAGKALEHGCAATWLTGTFDPQTGLLYWTAGNPCPDYNGDERGGDNLYSDSVLAIEAATGELRWHYQFTPHDLHDWDAQQTPMLIDTRFQGRDRKLLAQANRNGFFYVLDRLSGERLLAKPFVEKLTWARSIGPDGRPIRADGSDPTPGGIKVCPAVEGATNWMSTAFHPGTHLFYVMALEKCSVYLKAEAVWEPGKSHYGGDTRKTEGEEGRKYLRAIDIDTGRIVWEYAQHGPGSTWGGVLSMAGGVVFLGDDSGDFTAVNATSGKPVWRFPANQHWKASPMTYMVDGKQYVAIAAGANILAFSLP